MKTLPKVLVLTLAIGVVVARPATTAYAGPQTTTQDKPAPETPGAQDKRINGKWHFVFDTDGGPRDFDADFTVDGDGKISGTWGKSSADGTYKEGHLLLAFQITSEEAGETSQLTVDGALEGAAADSATISGKWTFSSYSGTFKATRPKP